MYARDFLPALARSASTATGFIVIILFAVGTAQAQTPAAHPIPAPIPTSPAAAPPAPPTAYTPPPVATPAAAPAAPGSALPPLPPGYPPVPPGYPGYPGYPPLSPVHQTGVLVDLRSSDPTVQIERVLEGGGSVPICRAPCRAVLPAHDTYVIKGDDIVPTSKFSLPAGHQGVILDVDPGSTSRRAGGAVLILAGIGSLYLAPLIGLSQDSDSDNNNRNKNNGEITAMIAIGGVVAMVVGLGLILTTKTTVSSSSGRKFSEAPPAKRGKTRAFAFTARGLEF